MIKSLFININKKFLIIKFMKTKFKKLPENKLENLLNNKNFRNNQNYIINYKKLKKEYFNFNLKKEDNNIFIQILFIFLFVLGLFIVIFIWKLIIIYNLQEIISAIIILLYLIIFPIYISYKWYSDFIYLFKKKEYTILKRNPYKNYIKYRELCLSWGINKPKYIYNELIIVKNRTNKK